MPRTFIDKNFSTTSRNVAFAAFDRAEYYANTSDIVHNSFSPEQDINLQLPYDLSADEKKKAYYAYAIFKKSLGDSYSEIEDKPIFEKVMYEHLSDKYLDKFEFNNSGVYKDLVSSIIADIKKSPEHKNNVECLIQLNKFIASNRAPIEEIDVNNEDYKVLFTRFRRNVNAHNKSLIEAGSEFAIKLNYIEDDNQRPELIGSTVRNTLYYIKKSSGDDKRLYYVDSSGKISLIATNKAGIESAIDLNNSEVSNQVQEAMQAGKLPAMRKLLGDKFPKDRGFELSQRMHKKSQHGPTVGQYAAAQLGMLASIPGSLSRLGKPSKTIKATRAKARRKQIKEDFVAQKFAFRTVNRRVEEIQAARNMLNAEVVGAGLVDRRPCNIRLEILKIEETALAKEDRIFKSYIENLGKTNGIYEDTYLVTSSSNMKDFRISFIDNSGILPIKREVACPNESAKRDLLYILGALDETHNSNQEVRRLRSKFAAAQASGDRQVNRELLSYITLITGHVPENQTDDDLTEKYEFSRQCDSLEEKLLAIENSFTGKDNLKSELEVLLEPKQIALLDTNQRPASPDPEKIYLYMDDSYPPECTLYQGNVHIKTTNLYSILKKLDIPSNFIFYDYEPIKIESKQYNDFLRWTTQGRKTPCPLKTQPGKVYYAGGNLKIWHSPTEGTIIDICKDSTGDHELNKLIETSSARLKNEKSLGFRYVEEGKSYRYNPLTNKKEITDTLRNGEAAPLRIEKEHLNFELIEKINKTLKTLRKIEDLPASSITTSESIVPYDTRRQLVASLDEYISNPNAEGAREYFRNSYMFYNKAKPDKPEACAFYYNSYNQSISYVDANKKVFTSKINYLMNNPIKDLLKTSSCKINSEEVYEYITKNLDQSTAFKMHTANEAVLEIVDEEVVSTKEACKHLAKALLVLGITLLFAFVPFVGQAMAIPGIGAAMYYISLAAQCIMMPFLFGKAASSFSKNPNLTSARQELMKLKEEISEISQKTEDIEEVRTSAKVPGRS